MTKKINKKSFLQLRLNATVKTFQQFIHNLLSDVSVRFVLFSFTELQRKIIVGVASNSGSVARQLLCNAQIQIY